MTNNLPGMPTDTMTFIIITGFVVVAVATGVSRTIFMVTVSKAEFKSSSVTFSTHK